MVFIVGAAIAFVVVFAWILGTTNAGARQMGEYSVKISPACMAKIRELRLNGINCCAAGDGWQAQEAVWNIKKGKYVVVIDKVEHDVPKSVLLHEPNCTGVPIVWYYWFVYEDERWLIIQCFWPGPEAELRAPQSGARIF